MRINKDYVLTIILLIVILSLWYETVDDNQSFDVDTSNVIYNETTNTIFLQSLTLRQKIGQMILAFGTEDRAEQYQEMFIGGIYLPAKPNKRNYSWIIEKYQSGSTIPFFVAVDMEGCWNPFENFKDFPTLRDIASPEEAYRVGEETGSLMKELGISINFAPVVDLQDTIWNCRNFEGTTKEVAKKANAYIEGLQSYGIIATAKHYPGRTLAETDVHDYMSYESINDEDLFPFKQTIRNNVSAIMISHVIVNGKVDSEKKPSVVSQELVKTLRDDFSGIIITDEIRMRGLSTYYNTLNEKYLDLFLADNDLILNFDTGARNLYDMITIVEQLVQAGKISEKRIDTSVERILRAKGFNVEK